MLKALAALAAALILAGTPVAAQAHVHHAPQMDTNWPCKGC